MKNTSARWLIAVVVAAAFVACFGCGGAARPLTAGQVSADRVDIGPTSPRDIVRRPISAIPWKKVRCWPNWRAATGLARLAAPAALAAGDLDRINSIRPETVAAREAELNAAKADETLAQETYDRQIELQKTGNVPQARVDEATRNLQLTMRKRESADAAFQLASQGASKEERALAAAQAKQAEATLNQRDVDVAEFIVRSPISGQVTTRVAALGENFSAGAPLFSMIDLKELWFTFTARGCSAG